MVKFPHLKYLGLAWLFVSLIIAAFAVSGVKMERLSCDVLQYLRQPIYLGQLSNLGILIWCTAASICLFTSGVLTVKKADVESNNFLRWLGILSLLLLIDDLLMVHEVIFPRYFNLSDKYFYTVYLAYVTLFLFKYWHFIFQRTDYIYLILAFILLGSSVALDMDLLPGGIDVEDSFKIFGILTYAHYAVITSVRLLKVRFGTATQPES